MKISKEVQEKIMEGAKEIIRFGSFDTGFETIMLSDMGNEISGIYLRAFDLSYYEMIGILNRKTGKFIFTSQKIYVKKSDEIFESNGPITSLGYINDLATGIVDSCLKLFLDSVLMENDAIDYSELNQIQESIGLDDNDYEKTHLMGADVYFSKQLFSDPSLTAANCIRNTIISEKFNRKMNSSLMKCVFRELRGNLCLDPEIVAKIILLDGRDRIIQEFNLMKKLLKSNDSRFFNTVMAMIFDYQRAKQFLATMTKEDWKLYQFITAYTDENPNADIVESKWDNGQALSFTFRNKSMIKIHSHEVYSNITPMGILKMISSNSYTLIPLNEIVLIKHRNRVLWKK